MKKVISIVGILVVLFVVAYLISLLAKSEPAAPVAGDTAEVAGNVVAVNMEQIAFDGPYLITLEMEGGTATVAVPSMGLPLCAAYTAGNIMDIAQIKAGATLEARGTVAEDGSIVPCEDAGHYLRVAAQ